MLYIEKIGIRCSIGGRTVLIVKINKLFSRKKVGSLMSDIHTDTITQRV